jgi:hypothetical protein
MRTVRRSLGATILAAVLATVTAGLVAPVPASSGAGLPDATSAGGLTANPACDNSEFIFGWKGRGDKVFARDCHGNGWGVKVSVYYFDPVVGEWTYAFKITDPSVGGDGGWKSRNLPEYRRVKLHAYEYQDGVHRRHNWRSNCVTECYKTTGNAANWAWYVYP